MFPLATSSTASEPVGLTISRAASAWVYIVKEGYSFGATVERYVERLSWMDAVGNANAVGAALPFNCGETRGGFGSRKGRKEARHPSTAPRMALFYRNACFICCSMSTSPRSRPRWIQKAWQERDYATIIAVAEKIPERIPMWYDQAMTRMGDEA